MQRAGHARTQRTAQPPRPAIPPSLPAPTSLQDDSTFKDHVIPFARRLSSVVAAAKPVPGCTPRTAGGSGSAGSIALGNSTQPASPAVQSFGGAPNNRRLMHQGA